MPPLAQVEALKKLGLSDSEVADVLATDKEIDRGAKLFELSPELEKGAKKARRADRKPNSTQRKPDMNKRLLIAMLAQFLIADKGFEVTVTNEEREFVFTYKGKKYKVTLSCPRS